MWIIFISSNSKIGLAGHIYIQSIWIDMHKGMVWIDIKQFPFWQLDYYYLTADHSALYSYVILPLVITLQLTPDKFIIF